MFYRNSNEGLTVELSVLVSRDFNDITFNAEVKTLKVVFYRDEGIVLRPVRHECYQGDSIQEVAHKMVKDDVLLKPDEHITTITAPVLQFLYGSTIKCPVDPEQIFDFERTYYRQAIKKFGDKANFDKSLVKIVSEK